LGFVYLIRNQDLYKIGRTDNLERRLQQLAPCSLVSAAETDRSRDLEHEMHIAFKHRRIPQTEYFRLSESEVIEVQQMLGVPSDGPISGRIRRCLTPRSFLAISCVGILAYPIHMHGFEHVLLTAFAVGIIAAPAVVICKLLRMLRGK
jgi:hypothetical protein